MVNENLYNNQAIKIQLVGDQGVGKTSIINSFVNHSFEPNLPARFDCVTIVASIDPEHIPLQIEDFSEREQSLDDLENVIHDASVICIVYSSSEQDSFDRVFDHWIPLLQKHQRKDHTQPMILIRNKVDLIRSETSFVKAEALNKIRDNLDGFIQVSALTQENVVELFYLAQKIVIYPKAPLYDSRMRVITKKCRSALIDIFRICDVDNDNLLNDNEINLFQEYCFGTPLQKDALDDLKSVIKQSTSDGIINNGITLAGFLFLHTLSIDNGQPHFTWQVLKKYNYDEKIDKRESVNSGAQKLEDLDQVSSKKISLLPSEVSECSSNFLPAYGHNDHVAQSDYKGSSSNSRTNQLDILAYYHENSKIIRTGLGFTLATVASFIAFKILISSGKNL